jgi:hypothetical protein
MEADTFGPAPALVVRFDGYARSTIWILHVTEVQVAAAGGHSSDPGQTMPPTPIRGGGLVCGTPPLSPALHAGGASWLNLVKRVFAEITDKRIRRGTFPSVGELVRAILDYIRRRNHSPQPFVWTAGALDCPQSYTLYEALEAGPGLSKLRIAKSRVKKAEPLLS